MVLSDSAADNTLLNLHNSSDHKKAEANNCYIEMFIATKYY